MKMLIADPAMAYNRTARLKAKYGGFLSAMTQRVLTTPRPYRIVTSNGNILIPRDRDILIRVTYPDGTVRDLTYEDVITDKLTILDNKRIANPGFADEVIRIRRAYGIRILEKYTAGLSEGKGYSLACWGVGYLVLEPMEPLKHQPELHFNASDDVMQWELTLTNDEEIILGTAPWNDEQAITDLCSQLIDREFCFTMYALLDPDGASMLVEQEREGL